MPDEAINAEVPARDAGTPPEPTATPPEAPAEAPSESPEIDWKQRYEDLRPEADRRQSVLADIEGRNGSERQAQALAEVARIELEEEEEEEPEDDFDLPPDPNERIDALERERAEEQEASQEAEFDRLESEYIENVIGGLEENNNLKLSDAQYSFIVNNALANRDPHDGKPDLEGSFNAWKSELESAGQNWLKSKETVMPPLGTEGEKKITPEILRNKDKRQQLGAEIYEAAERAKAQ